MITFSGARLLLGFQHLFRFAVLHRIRFVYCRNWLYLFPWTWNIELIHKLCDMTLAFQALPLSLSQCIVGLTYYLLTMLAELCECPHCIYAS